MDAYHNIQAKSVHRGGSGVCVATCRLLCVDLGINRASIKNLLKRKLPVVKIKVCFVEQGIKEEFFRTGPKAQLLRALVLAENPS